MKATKPVYHCLFKRYQRRRATAAAPVAEVKPEEIVLVSRGDAEPHKIPDAAEERDLAADADAVGVDEEEVIHAWAGRPDEDVPVRKVAMEDALVVGEDEKTGERRQEPGKVFGRERPEEVADLPGVVDPGGDEVAFDDEAALTALE